MDQHLSQIIEDLRDENRQLRDACSAAKCHLYAAKTQRSASDDQIIAGHIDQAYAALAVLNAGVPEPVTSMNEPCYWVEVDREFQADRRAGSVI